MNNIGRYELVEKLGQGGMGVVYRAFDPLLQRVVAVKLIGTSIEADGELRERFFREARAAGQLSHKNIITIHDLGEHEGQPFLAMEYLEGQDLQHRMASHVPMSMARKLELAIEICEGIEHAHVHGVVHRDIKPANIFITAGGTAKILDFGLARLITSELTNSNMMMGTLNYMAPEQVRGERADHRSDIFSTGVVLYEILGGRKAFEGDSFGATLYKILQEVPEPLRNIDASLPADLVSIVERALEKTREERYQHMSEMLAELTAYRQQQMLLNSPAFGRPSGMARVPSDIPRPAAAGSVHTVPARPGADTPIAHDAPTIASVPAAALSRLPASGAAEGGSPATTLLPAAVAPARRRTSSLVAAGAGVLLLGALALWGFTRGSSPTPAAESPGAAPVAAAPADAPAAAATPDAAAQQASDDVARNLASAREAFKAGRFDEASRAAGEVLALEPGHVEARRMMDEGAARSQGKGAEEARTRMTRARTAAAAASAQTLAAAPYAVALSAEREASTLQKRGRLAEAMAKFWEASGLFHSAEIAARAEAAARAERARSAAAPATIPAPAPVVPQPPAVSAPPAQSLPLPTVTPPAAPAAAQPPAAAPPSAPADTAPPQPPPTSGIAELLDRYKSALENRSLESLRRLWPTLGGAQETAIRREFQNASRIEVEIGSPQITLNGTTATVRFLRTYQLVTVDGQRLRTESRTTMQLERSGPSWTIEAMRFDQTR